MRDTRPDGSVYDLAYDAGGRLAAAAQNGAAIANYRFNARGERVAKIAGGRRAHSLYDTKGQLLAEYDAGAATATLVPPAPEATLDNTDPGAGGTGGWASAAERPGYLGTDYAVVQDGTSSDVFTWTPTVPSAGQYQVFARWPADANRGTKATYTVTHQAGTTPVTVDQRRSGGQWVPLGAFELAPGAGHKIELSGEAEPFGGSAEIIVDNGDPAAVAAGTWTAASAAPGYWGADFLYAAPGGGNSFSWTPALPEAGRYAVYARWSTHANRATDAPYRIHHAGGVTTVRVNQEVDGGAWVFLGLFALDPGEGHRVVLGDDANEYVIADAVKFLRDAAAVAPAEEVVVDNSAATVVGSWTASTNPAAGAFRGADWLYHAAGTGANSVTWAPAIPAAGRYTVYARWTVNANRATNAPYTVHHAGGQTTVPVNQELSGGIWVPLGAFDFAPGQGHKVVLTDNANEYVVADAVKLVRDAGTGVDGIVVDNLQATRVGAWSTASGAPGYWGSEFHYSAAGTGADTITWTPALTQTGQYRVYARWTYNANRATNAPYTVHHAGGSTTIRVNQEQNGGEWVPLGSFDLAPGQNHRVVLSDDANEYVIGDAVKFVLETNARAVVADAIRIVGESAPAGDFAATSSTVLREYVISTASPWPSSRAARSTMCTRTIWAPPRR